jgi:hypothetical protein
MLAERDFLSGRAAAAAAQTKTPNANAAPEPAVDLEASTAPADEI